MKGRKPKPVALHTLHGNPSNLKKPVLESRMAIEPDDATLDAPPGLTPRAREIWDDAIASAPPGILKRIDRAALRVWAVACDLHERACEGLLDTPTLLVRGPAGSVPQQSPYLAIINRQGVMMLRAGEQLGFTPVSRPRLFNSSPPPPEPASLRQGPRGRADTAASLDDYIAAAPTSPLH